CNSKVFAPVASVECAIITFIRKNNDEQSTVINDGESTVVKTDSSSPLIITDGESTIVTIDYREDGYEVRKKVRVKVREPTIKESSVKCLATLDWNYSNNVNNLSREEISELIEKYNIELTLFEYNKKKGGAIDYSPLTLYRSFREFNEVIPMNSIDEVYDLYTDHPRVGDYFEQVKSNKNYTIVNSNVGDYPLISRTSKNNGIVKYIDEFSLDGTYISVSNGGSVGYCFVQNGKFSVTTGITILQPKDSKTNLHVWAMLLTNKLSNKYSYSNGLTITKLMNEEL
ncbi:MAG: restriction endonuclease subunit S, partial [Acholeplasmataceae bacterium]